MALREAVLNASNLGQGLLDDQLAAAVKEIRNAVVDNHLGAGKGTITVNITVFVEDDGERARLQVSPVKVKKPEAKAKGQYVRFDEAGAPKVDVDETHELNRQLPFPKEVAIKE